MEHWQFTTTSTHHLELLLDTEFSSAIMEVSSAYGVLAM
jgi:hypothetical protein